MVAPKTAGAWVVVLLLAGCGADASEDAAPGSDVGESTSQKPGDGAPASSPTNGAKDGDETDVDCGGASTPKCADGKACASGDSCASGVCASGACAAPTATDGVKNGDETDVDCGGASTNAPKCAAGLKCAAHADCATGGCDYKGTCALAPSCVGHFGGDTCGQGEVGTPGAAHESCCTSLPVNRPADKGGPYVLDKYLVTAGRMRAFIERFGGNIRAQFAGVAPPPGWGADWTNALPDGMDNAQWTLGPWADGRNGCQIANGTRTYWLADDVNKSFSDVPEHYSKDTLDQKVQNCAPAVLFYAFCAWDGGRLASSDEIIYAWRGADGRAFPWGNAPSPTDDHARANVGQYGHYIFPADALDNSAYMSAPGRMTGNGPFGHADLMGPVLMNVRDNNLALLYTGSLEGHSSDLSMYPGWGAQANAGKYHLGAYGMAGARCAR